jgi:heat-inducible transcriptional repressor
VHLDLTEWLRLSAAILAQSVHNAALITAPKVAESHVKHLELISIQDSIALLVLVLQGGLVQQQMMMLLAPASQETLSAAASRLNRMVEGKTGPMVEHLASTLSNGLERDTAVNVARLMVTHDLHESPIVYYDGLANILGQQEFTVAAQAKSQERQQMAQGMLQMLELLQQGVLFRHLLPHVMDGAGVQVFIGGEGEHEDLRHFSVIVSRYGGAGGGTGMLGVLGPTRMHYGRAVAVVRYMTDLLTELAGELNG